MAGKKGMHDKYRFSEEYQNKLRAKIEAHRILQKLTDHVVKGTEMSASQVQAGLGLLRKVLPELASTEVRATVTHWTEAIQRIAQADQHVTPTPPADDVDGQERTSVH